jgi:hypothetical protein
MAKFTEEQVALARELSTRDNTTDEQRTFAREILSRSEEQKEKTPQDVNLAQDALQAVRELPTNAKIGFMNLGASALQNVSRRGIQITFGAAKAFGLSDEEATAMAQENFLGHQPQQGRPALIDQTRAERRNLQSQPQGFGVGAEALRVATRAPFAVGARIKGRAQDLNSQLSEATFRNNFITKSFRSTVQSGMPSLTAAIGVTMLTGNPMIGLASLGETEGASAFFDQLEGGASIPKASLIGELSEAVEIATEALVFTKLFKGITKGIPIKEAMLLVAENATQEAAAGLAQTFLQQYGLLTSQGMDKKKAASQAFEAGLKAVPESAWVGALTSGGALTTSSVVNKVMESTTKARESQGQEVSRAPGSATKETTPVPSTPVARTSTVANSQPILDNNMESRSAKTTAVDNQRDIAEGLGLDSTIKPSDVLAAETLDQTRETSIKKDIDAAFLKKDTTRIEEIAENLPKDSALKDEALHIAFVMRTQEGKQAEKLTAGETDTLKETLKDLLSSELAERSAEKALAEESRKKAFQIKALQSDLGLNDRDYRKALYESTEKNSTTAMSLTELDKVITDLNFKKSKKYLTDEPVRLKLTEKDLSEIKGSVASIGDDIWRNVLTNEQYALPEDPFSHKKMFNILKTKVRKQQDFVKRTNQKSSENVVINTRAHAAESTANFFGSFQSYRNFFSDLDQQTGIPVFGRYQNLIDSSATAKADAQRAFSNVLELHGMTKMPQFSRLKPGDFATVNRLNKALYFSPPEGMSTEDMSTEQLEAINIRKSFSPSEQNHFDTLKDLFNSDASRPNTGPNAVRLRGYQWRVWNKAYNEMTPQISEAQADIDLDQRQLNNLLVGNENLQNRTARLQEVDQEIFDITQATPIVEVGPIQPLADPAQMALLIQERQDLETEIKQLESVLPTVEKKRISGLKKKIKDKQKKILQWQKNIKDSTPVTSLEGKKKLTEPNVLQAGKKAQQEGRFYDWLGRQTFGTKEIYFVGQDAFDTWFKSVADKMKPGVLGLTQRAHAGSISDTATRSRIKVGDPILNKNPYGVARTRLTKLSLLDELFSPINDMNSDIQKAWDNMSSGQTQAYAAWMDNMVGVYTDPGKVVKALQVIQKQWWRAYGWTPQRVAKFWTRNLGQITLVSSQVSVPRFLAAAPVGYAGFHMQAQQQKLQQKGQSSEIDQLDMQDLQNQLRDSINQSKERSSAVVDPWLYEDWRQFAATEVSQKAAQYALLTQQESTRTGSGDTNWQDAMPSLLGVSDTMGRWATWVPLHQLAFSNMKLLREGSIGDKQLWSRLSLDTLENPQKDELMALKENNQDRQFVRKYANMKTKNVHYAYDLNERTPVEQSAASRSILGVITWPRSAMENYVRLAKNGVDGIREGDMMKARQAAYGTIKYLAGFGILGVLSARAARDPWYGILRSINPIGFVGSPQLSHLEETSQVLNNVWDGDLNNLPSDEKWEAVISELVDKIGLLALPAAVGVMEGWKTMVEARHGLNGVKTVDLMQSVFKGKSELFMGGEEAFRTEEEKYLKFFFNEEKQESREVRRIPGL